MHVSEELIYIQIILFPPTQKQKQSSLSFFLSLLHLTLIMFYLLNENSFHNNKHFLDPARFSPDDKFSRQRVSCKKRFGLYLPDHPQKPL